MAQTEVETRTVEDYRPNHSLDRIGAYIRRGLIGVSVLFGAYIGIRQMTEQAQPNAPQPAYEHAFIEGDKKEPKVGDIYYQERRQNDDKSISFAKVIVINKLVIHIGGEQIVIAVVTRMLDKNGIPIPGTENTCPLLGLYEDE